MIQEEENKISQIPAVKPTYEEMLNEYEQIPSFDYNSFRENWKKGQKPMMEALMGAYQKPEVKVTPEQAKRAKNASAISDAFSSLAEIVTLAQGGAVRNRGGQSSQKNTNDRLQALQDKYEQDMIRYNTLRGNAEMQDFQQQLKAAMAADGQKRKNILLRAEYAKQLEAEARKAAAEEAKYLRTKKDKAEAAALKHKNDLSLIRERARYKSSGGGGGGKDTFSGLFLNAHPNDPNSVVDQLGRKVVPVNLSKQQISGYANSAKSDASFLQNYPHAYVDTFDPLTGKVVKGLTNDNNLAWMYAQYLYDQGFTDEQPQALPEKPRLKRANPMYQPKDGWGNANIKAKENQVISDDDPDDEFLMN